MLTRHPGIVVARKPRPLRLKKAPARPSLPTIVGKSDPAPIAPDHHQALGDAADQLWRTLTRAPCR